MEDVQKPAKSDKKGDKSREKLDFQRFLQLIHEFDDATSEWRMWADGAWNEFKRSQENVTRVKKNKKKFPLWWATNKVRQPLVFSRVPEPVIKPVVNDKDGIITQAGLVCETLANSLLNEFPFKKVVSSARDDVLNTSIGVTRIMLDAEFVEEPVRIYLTEIEEEVQDPNTGQIQVVTRLVDEAGNPVQADIVLTDAEGRFYIESDELVQKVKKERVFLKPVPYCNFIWDHEALEFSEWEFCGFRSEMTTREIKRRFGEDVLNKLLSEEEGRDEMEDALDPRHKHKIVEFWYEPHEKRYIFAEEGSGFLDVVDDPYGLGWFFPIAYPVFTNLPTDANIPTPEFAEVSDLLASMDNLYTRRSEAIELARPRALYDSEVQELSALITKARQGQYIGVPNLSTKVQQGQTLVQYLDVNPILTALNEFRTDIQFDLQFYDQLTGFSDIVRGVTNPYESATAQERKSQFSNSRISDLQEDMQRYCKDLIKLLLDLALGKFSDERIFEILQPSLEPEQLQNWDKILKILRSDWKLFLNLDIETDSTIMIDEDADKAHALETAQYLGQFMQQTAQIAANQPELTPLAVKILEHVIRKCRGGRAFQDDVEKTIENILEKAAQQSQQPAPDIEMMKVQLEQQKLASTQQLEGFKAQLRQQEMQLEAQISAREMLQKEYQLQLDAEKLKQDANNSQIKLALEGMIADFNSQIETQRLEIQRFDAQMQAAESAMEEQRLAKQQEIDWLKMHLDDARNQRPQEPQIITLNPPELPPINVNVEASRPGKRVGKIVRDELGNATLEVNEEPF